MKPRLPWDLLSNGAVVGTSGQDGRYLQGTSRTFGWALHPILFEVTGGDAQTLRIANIP
jgi:hypothetical protein